MMNICDNHFFGLVILVAVVIVGIVSVIKEEKNG